MIEIDNKVIVLDFDDIINQNNEYKSIILNSNDNIMTIPYKYTVYKQIRDNFKSKSLVILTSDAMFNDFLTENEKKINTVVLLPSTKYYSQILMNLEDTQKQIFIKSYNSLENLNNIKYFDNQFQLNQQILNFFI